jgi:hypothetical protein
MPTPVPDDVAAYAARDFTSQDYDQADAVLAIVTAEVSAWTRGNGFDDAGKPNTELWSVIVAEAARRMTNPFNVIREEMGGLVVQHALPGFTLTQQRVLNRYRERAK